MVVSNCQAYVTFSGPIDRMSYGLTVKSKTFETYLVARVRQNQRHPIPFSTCFVDNLSEIDQPVVVLVLLQTSSEISLQRALGFKGL